MILSELDLWEDNLWFWFWPRIHGHHDCPCRYRYVEVKLH